MNTQPKQDPIIPPSLLLGIAGIAFLVAFAVAFTQGPTGTTIAIAAFGVGLASLIGWGLFAPDQLRAFITGRGVRFGGLSIVVTLVFIVALIAVYSVVKSRNWRIDLTEQDTFTLNAPGREAMASLGADSRVPPIKIYAFYGAGQAGRRDQDTLLFDDYQDASNRKVTYEFVDPDKNPVLAEQLGITRPGQIAIVGNNPDGTQDIEGAQLINFVSQEELSNAILRVAATGDFRAYVLTVEEGLSLDATDSTGLANLKRLLVNGLSWKAQQVSIVDLTTGAVDLADPLANGIVLVIPGGKTALSDDALKFITDYLDAGGDAVILADINVDVGEESLATADNLTNYLRDNYGVSFNRGVVLDTRPALESPLVIFTTDIPTNTPITSAFAGVENVSLILDAPHPIDIAPNPPANVTVTPLVNAGDTTFTKTIEQLVNGDVNLTDSDPKGPFTLAAMAENTATGSRVVLIGSREVAGDRYAQFASLNVLDLEFMLRSMVWATKFEDFFGTLPSQIQREARPQDAPIFASQQTLTAINLITVLVLPFGALALGVYVWWSRRTGLAKES